MAAGIRTLEVEKEELEENPVLFNRTDTLIRYGQAKFLDEGVQKEGLSRDKFKVLSIRNASKSSQV